MPGESYKATAIISWEFQSETQEIQLIEEIGRTVDAIIKDYWPTDCKNVRKTLKLGKFRVVSDKLRIAEVDPQEVFKRLSQNKSKQEFEINGEKYLVRLNSSRYFVFRDNPICVSCGLQGTQMILEKYATDNHPHFNLYGEYKQQLVMMTKDHILAKCNGGPDRHSNYQCMCQICNNLKGSSSLSVEATTKIRQIYDQNVDHLSQKDLYLLIDENRNQLAQPYTKSKTFKKISSDTVITACDLNLYEEKDGFFATPVYANSTGNWLACITQGTYFQSLVSISENTIVELPKTSIVASIPNRCLKVQNGCKTVC